MLCDKCHKREAKIYYTEIVNGVKKEQHLCEECASEYTNLGFDSKLEQKDISIGNLLSSILSNYYPAKKSKEHGKEGLVCRHCNMSYESFLQHGKVGCVHCYQSFNKVLEKSLRQIQGASSHIGKQPKGFVRYTDKILHELSEIDRLSIQLQDAIEKEEFEEAARLRDEIRRLRNKEGIENG